MAIVLRDRVRETTATTGTGTVTLDGAVDGFQPFSVLGDGSETYYAIVLGTEWEVGVGTYTSSGTTLSRDEVLDSSNSGSLVDFAVGIKDVFVTYPAGRSLTGGGGGVGALVVNADVVTEDYTVAPGTNAQSVGPVTVADGKTVTVSSGQRWLIV